MADMPSAQEIAQARIAAVGEATDIDKLRWKYHPEGERVAVKYLKEGADFTAEANRLPEEAQPFFKAGVETVLLANLALPKTDALQARNKKVIEGELTLKKDKAATTRVLNQVKQIFSHYTDQGAKQRETAFDTLKEQYELKIKKALSKQLGAKNKEEDLGINVEGLPEFQEEWRVVAAQLEGQYLKLLEEFKHELMRIK
jgi:hypothetical protein